MLAMSMRLKIVLQQKILDKAKSMRAQYSVHESYGHEIIMFNSFFKAIFIRSSSILSWLI